MCQVMGNDALIHKTFTTHKCFSLLSATSGSTIYCLDICRHRQFHSILCGANIFCRAEERAK